MGLGVDVTYGGLSVGAFADEVKDDQGETTNDGRRDAMSATWYANYSMGPVSFGYQAGGLDRGLATAATAATSAKTVAAAGGNFEFEKMSIAFNVNENLSISYGTLTETYDAQGVDSVADVDLESDSIQFAYTMGSMSIKGYQTDER